MLIVHSIMDEPEIARRETLLEVEVVGEGISGSKLESSDGKEWIIAREPGVCP